MGYIKDNIDAFIAEGYTPKEAEVQAAILDANLDYGYCNPIKAKFAAEEEDSIRREVENRRPCPRFGR